MNENLAQPGDDEAMARLRAADPAASVEPELAATRAAVTARIVAADAGVATDVDAGVVDELAVVRSRRGGGWMARVAGIAAGAVVLVGGGYAAGQARDDGGGTAAAPAISLQADASGKPAGATAEGSAGVAGPAVAAGAAPAAAVGARMAYWGGRTVFQSSGLSDAAGTADAWAYDAASVFSKETVVRLAAALGVTGEPTLVDGGWMVGSNDVGGVSVQLSPDGAASVNYYNSGNDPKGCGVVAQPAEERNLSTEDTPPTASGSSSAGSSGMPAEPEPAATDGCDPTTFDPAPQGDAALAVAKAVLASIGVDVGTLELEASEPSDGDLYSWVAGYQVLNGQRTGLSWNVNFSGAGLQSLNGPIAPLVAIGSYDVISEQDAVARLNDARFGASYTSGPMLYEGPVAASGSVRSSGEVVPAPAPSAPPTIAPGSAIAWPVQDVTIVKARLGLAVTFQPDGSALLLPSYELSGADGSTWSVLAVADRHLDLSAG